MLVLDEVMTGFCRTGEMLAADLHEVEPDLLTMGKCINSSYLPCGAFHISDRIIEVIHGSSLSGFTHAAHPLALAGADAAIDVYLEDDVAAGVRAMSRCVKARFRDEFVELDVAAMLTLRTLCWPSRSSRTRQARNALGQR